MLSCLSFVLTNIWTDDLGASIGVVTTLPDTTLQEEHGELHPRPLEGGDLHRTILLVLLDAIDPLDPGLRSPLGPGLRGPLDPDHPDLADLTCLLYLHNITTPEENHQIIKYLMP